MHSLAIIAGLLFTAVSATPLNAPQSLQTRQDPDWSFSVYQSNARCTGARDSYSGTGSTDGCQRGIRNGSFGSYTNNGVREGCTVYLYDNADCDPVGIIDVLEHNAPEGCQQPAIVVNDAVSWEAICD